MGSRKTEAMEEQSDRRRDLPLVGYAKDSCRDQWDPQVIETLVRQVMDQLRVEA